MNPINRSTYQFPDLDPDILDLLNDTIRKTMLYAKPASVRLGDVDGERKKPGQISCLVDYTEARGLHTEEVQSLDAADPREDIPEWASDDRAVLNVLSFLYTDQQTTSLGFDVINHKWRKHEPAEGARAREMSEKAIKQVLYRVRKCGNEVLALGPDGRWQLTKESFRRLLNHYRKKGKVSPERQAFYERYLSGEKIHMWEWPDNYVRISLRLLQKNNPEAFGPIEQDLIQLAEILEQIKSSQLLLVKAALFECVDELDPFYKGLFDFTID